MNTFAAWLDRKSLYIALLAAWIAMFGSLFFSEVMGFVPCLLCWYQRILMYPLTLILAIGLLRRDGNLPHLVLPFSLLGMGIATYHYLLEKTDLFPESTTCGAGASCTTVWINWFGFVTIPFLSLVGFLTITVMTVIALQAGEVEADEERSRPWLTVLALIVIPLVAYGVLAQVYKRQTAIAPAFTVIEPTAAQAQSHVTATGSTAAEPLATGARLYLDSCASCHGPQAEGVAGLGSVLVTSDFVRTHSDEDLLRLIRTGRAVNDPANLSGLVMPPSGGRPDLTDQQLLAIIAYLRTLTAQ